MKVSGRMLVLFMLASVTLKVVSGIEMCKGPYEPPTLVEVITTPVYDYMYRVLEVEVSLEVISRIPVYMQWWSYMNSYTRVVQATEDSETFRSSVETTGDQSIFKVKIILPESVSNITDILKTIHTELDVVYDCNAVGLTMSLDDLIQLTRDKVKPPIITEMPRGRYVLDEEGTYYITAGFTKGPGKKPPRLHGQCREFMERRNGRLSVVKPTVTAQGSLTGEMNSTRRVLNDLGVTQTMCQVVFEKGQESVYVSTSFRFSGGAASVRILVEFRRSSVNSPAIVVDNWYGRLVSRGRTPVIATKQDVTEVMCFADAASKPFIAMARAANGGDYELLTGYVPDYFYVSLGYVRYSVESPLVSEEKEYICSAATGEEVISQKFKIVRHDPVSVKNGGGLENSVSLEQANKSYDLSCEAAGVPQPKITFYWSPTSSIFYPLYDPKAYQESNKDREIHDSDLFVKTTRVENGKIIGFLHVKDINKVIEALPVGYWDNNYNYELVCFAYNEFTSSSQGLVSFYRTDSFNFFGSNFTFFSY